MNFIRLFISFVFILAIVEPIDTANADSPSIKWFSVSEADWLVRTDKTERPKVGKSELQINQGLTLQANGWLYSLPGIQKRVGFALIESEQRADSSQWNEICMDFSASPKDVHFQVLLKDDQADQTQGTLTFQYDFVPVAGNETYCFPLREFVGTVRGVKYPDFRLNQKRLRSFSIQISRSAQEEPIYSISPLKFSFVLSGEVRFR